MRHNYKGRKLGTDSSHTKAMKRSLVKALLYNDRIKTTEARAKEIRPDVDHIITWAKKGDLHSRRLAIAAVGNDKELIREVFEKVDQGLFADRQGGYTRILKLGNRKGDNAPMVIMELCTEPVAKKADKATPKKVEKTNKSTKADEAEDKVEEVTEEVEADVTEPAAEKLEDIEEAIQEEAEEAVEEADAEGDEEAAAEAAEVAEEAEEAEEATEEVADEAADK